MKIFLYSEQEIHDPKRHIHYFRTYELVKISPTENNPWGYGYKDIKK